MTQQPQDRLTRAGRPARVAVADIVDVAIELFGSRGLRGTSIAAVAERAGLTDAGLLHHFRSKADLIDAVVVRSAQLQTDRMRDYVAPGGLEAIRRMAAWGEVMEETPELVAVQIVLSTDAILDGSTVRQALERRNASVVALARGLIDEGIARGEIRPDADAEWEARSLISFLDGIRLQWLYSGRELPIAALTRRYVVELVARLERRV
jgi:AcrR family transcriptional regulator